MKSGLASLHLVLFNHTMNYLIFAVACMITYYAVGISLDKPIVTSCGTGVTACILALVSRTYYFSPFDDPCMTDILYLGFDFVLAQRSFSNFVHLCRACIDLGRLMFQSMMVRGQNGEGIQMHQSPHLKHRFYMLLTSASTYEFTRSTLFNFFLVNMTAGVVSWNNETV